MRMVDLIMKKRNGKELADEEIRFIIDGYTKGDIPDYQMSAFTMAVFFKGMNKRETLALTMAMAESRGFLLFVPGKADQPALPPSRSYSMIMPLAASYSSRPSSVIEKNAS